MIQFHGLKSQIINNIFFLKTEKKRDFKTGKTRGRTQDGGYVTTLTEPSEYNPLVDGSEVEVFSPHHHLHGRLKAKSLPPEYYSLIRLTIYNESINIFMEDFYPFLSSKNSVTFYS